MLYKLAMRNVRRSVKDYSIYILTVTLSLSLVYAFNMLVFSPDIGEIMSGVNEMVMIMIFISCIVVFVIGWLINYMTKFMLERRSREFGTYMVLGIPGKSISRLFLTENLLMGFFCIVFALLFGSLLYQILAMIIMKIFESPYKISAVFSWKALMLTLLYTFCIYAYALLKIRRRLRKVKVYDLLYADKKNENTIIKQGRHWQWFAVFLAAMAAGCICLWYTCHEEELTYRGSILLLGVCLIIGSIYGIYMTFTSFISGVLLSGGSFKYKHQRMFLYRNLTAKLRTMGVTLGTLALLLTLTLASTQLGLLFKDFFEDQQISKATFDIAISTKSEQETFPEMFDYVQERTEILDQYKYPIYESTNKDVYQLLKDMGFKSGWLGFDPFMSYSDYCYLRQMLNLDAVPMPKDGYLVQAIPREKEYIEQYIAENKNFNIEVSGKRLSFGGCYDESFALGAGFNGTGYVVIVDDSLVKNFDVYHYCHVIQTKNMLTQADDEWLKELYFNVPAALNDEFILGEMRADSCYVKGAIINQSRSLFTIFAFGLFYIGLIFICVSATILTVQQLSEASKYQYRYSLLSKLGLCDKAIRRLILKQIAVYFGIPLLIPIPLSIFISVNMRYFLLLDMITATSFRISVAAATGLFFFIYLIYFIATYISYRKSVLND